jgi:hypothetical protein
VWWPPSRREPDGDRGEEVRRRYGVVAVGLLALTACGGGGHPSGVASLSGPHAGATTTTPAGKQNVAQLYAKWAECIRQHGIDLVDPVVDDQGEVNISLPPGVSQQTYEAANTACQSLHQAAQTAARGGRPPEKPDPTKMINFSKCMRAHGVRDFPDPSANGGLTIQAGPGSDLGPDNPTFVAAQKACQPILGPMQGGEKVSAVGPKGG